MDLPAFGGDSLFFKSGSKLILEQNAEIFTCFRGGLVFESGASASWNNSSCVRAFPNSGFNFSGTHTVNNGGFIVIDGNANLKLGDSTTLTFDGSTSYLNLKSSSQVKLGHNAKIVFKNGAYLRANGATFSQTSSGKISNGLVFENSGLDSIVNCIFSNAKTAITIKNDSISLAGNNNNIIRRNTFNISQSYGRGLDVRNVFNLLLDSNTFNFSSNDMTVGLYFRNSINTSGGGGASGPASSYSLNITRNRSTNGGYIPMYLSCLAADRTPFYVYDNKFSGDNHFSLVNVKTSGNIKKNIFDNGNSNRAIGLWNSNANIYGNNIESEDLNLYLNYSFPVLSPVRDENYDFYWIGGRNNFKSETGENILMATSLPVLDFGFNEFIISSSTLNHLFGSLTDTNVYRMRYNCWIGNYDTAQCYLYKYVRDTILKIIPALYVPKYYNPSSVITESSPAQIISRGNGVYDTVITTDEVLEYIEDDESLIIQARADYRNSNFPSAITNYKGLIDNYPYSFGLFSSLNELYDCYKGLDTSEDETTRDILYGDFKQYLEDKILSNSYDTTFEDVAYEFILICETKMEKYDIALTGYEFMALYHPDAEQRMLASWDYEDIDELLGGGEGGGKAVTSFKLQVTSEEQGRIEALYELREFKQLNRKINDDPVMRKLKKSWDNESKKKKEKQLKENKTGAKLKDYVKEVQNDKLILRAKENIMRGKYLPKEEREVRRIEDMRILFGEAKTELQTDNINTSLPGTYSLSQNFPNPFNPTTKINFSIPKPGFVTLKVYDILGKEIMRLVNEQRHAGNYEVEFNGNKLPSGVYFYRIESGEFVDAKRMVMIK